MTTTFAILLLPITLRQFGGHRFHVLCAITTAVVVVNSRAMASVLWAIRGEREATTELLALAKVLEKELTGLRYPLEYRYVPPPLISCIFPLLPRNSQLRILVFFVNSSCPIFLGSLSLVSIAHIAVFGDRSMSEFVTGAQARHTVRPL